MRVLGFAKKWSKLQKSIHTTFRFPRKDSDRGYDWHIGEVVQEVYHTRCADREILGIAEIVNKEPKRVCDITDEESVEDGFPNGKSEMIEWLAKEHHCNSSVMMNNTINKLTLRKSGGITR